MKKYIVVWFMDNAVREFADVIDGVLSEQEAVDKVRRVHPGADVKVVGIMSSSSEWM